MVHVDHGIGQFEGLRQVAIEGANGEFMLLKFADDAKLYVPLARIDLIQKYTSLGGVEPQLDRLGTTVWEARKSRVKKSVSDMADQLLEFGTTVVTDVFVNRHFRWAPASAFH